MSQQLDDRKQFPTVRQMATAAYERLACTSEGTLLTYEELTRSIEYDAHSKAGQEAVRRAAKRLLFDRNLLVVNRKNEGYEVVTQSEHEKESRRQQTMGRRRFRRSADVMRYTEYDRITDAIAKDRALQQQVRAAMLEVVVEKLSKTKKLPVVERLSIPSGEELVKILTQ